MTIKERLENLARLCNESDSDLGVFRADCPNDTEGSVLLRAKTDGRDRIIFSTAIHTPGVIYHAILPDGRYLMAP